MAKAMPNTAIEIDGSVDFGTPAHYVDWGAIVAGAFIAAAISAVFLTFGSAIGLSVTSFQSGNSTSVTGLVIAAALVAVMGPGLELYGRGIFRRAHAPQNRRRHPPRS